MSPRGGYIPPCQPGREDSVPVFISPGEPRVTEGQVRAVARKLPPDDNDGYEPSGMDEFKRRRDVSTAASCRSFTP